MTGKVNPSAYGIINTHDSYSTEARKHSAIVASLSSRPNPATFPGAGMIGRLPDQGSPEADAQRIKELLHHHGLFGKDRNKHMHEIAGILTRGNPAHVNAVLSHLSDADIQKLVHDMNHGMTGGMQGLNRNERESLFKTLASKASPEQYGRLAAAQVHDLLGDQGPGGIHRNDNMHEIAKLLTNGDSAHVNALLSRLSDADLKKLVHNMNHGLTGGMQGLNRNEREALFKTLASKASPEQYGRLAAAQVHDLLGDQGPGGIHRNDNMHEIAKLLNNGDSAHVNALLSHLSDADMRKLAHNMNHGLTGGMQGLSRNEREALFKTLASKASPEQYGRLAAAQVHDLLNNQGPGGIHRNDNMHEIAKLLTNGDSAHVNALLSHLSDADLQKLADNMDHGLTGGMQGLSRNEREALFTALASKASPKQYGRLAASEVRSLLNGHGFAGTDRQEHMREIAKLMSTGDSAHLNSLLSHLSNSDLRKLFANADHGMVLGMQGLNDAEQGALFKQLAQKGDATQLVRALSAMESLHPKNGSPQMAHMTMLMTAIGKHSSKETQNAVLDQLSRSPQFSYLSRMDQFKGHDGAPIWQVKDPSHKLSPEQLSRLSQERRFALASLLMQQPDLTPQQMLHDQDMAYLSLGAYQQHPQKAGRQPSLPAGFPSDTYEVVKNYSDNSTLSGLGATLYHNKRDDTYTLAFCGTDQGLKEYLTTNIPQGAGLPAAQYDEAIALARSLKAQYGDQLTDITGHSLGGGLAAAAGMATSTRTTTFDAAGVNRETMERNHASWNPGVVTNFSVRGELLSKVQDYYPTRFVAPGAVGKQVVIEPFVNFDVQTEPGLSGRGLDGSAKLHSQDLIAPGMLGQPNTEWKDWPGYIAPAAQANGANGAGRRASPSTPVRAHPVSAPAEVAASVPAYKPYGVYSSGAGRVKRISDASQQVPHHDYQTRVRNGQKLEVRDVVLTHPGQLNNGQRIPSPVTGTVVAAGPMGSAGNAVVIRANNGGLVYLFHMSRIGVKTGQHVTYGQEVGRQGTTGHSTGPHVHIEASHAVINRWVNDLIDGRFDGINA